MNQATPYENAVDMDNGGLSADQKERVLATVEAARIDEGRKMVKAVLSGEHFYPRGEPNCVFCGVFGPIEDEEPCAPFFRKRTDEEIESSNAKKKLFDDIKKRYEDADLDDQVHEIMSLKASAINNAGIDAQLSFLADESGLDWLKEYFLDSPTSSPAPCEACGGVGWLETTEDKIERCDTCKKFNNDSEAEEAFNKEKA